MTYKISFWLNTPTHHQSDFLEALNNHSQIDLKVYFFGHVAEDRKNMGWEDIKMLPNYQKFVIGLDDGIKELIDWRERIHIVAGNKHEFNKKLLSLLIKNNVRWCHWSERYGVGLAKRVNYSLFLFKLLRPLFLLTKFSYGKCVNKYALGAFAIGELARKDLIYIGINKSKINYLFYALNPLKKNQDKLENIDKNKISFLYVGSLYKGKGIDVFLKAFSEINDLETELVLVGPDKSNGAYKELAKTLQIDKRVRFTGTVPVKFISRYMSACNIFVLPSLYDGWGVVLNEAVSLGLPIISTNQTGAAFHLVKNNVNGFVVKADSVHDLAVAMEKYAKSKKLIELHGNASKTISQNFTPNKNVDRFVEAIEKWIKLKDN